MPGLNASKELGSSLRGCGLLNLSHPVLHPSYPSNHLKAVEELADGEVAREQIEGQVLTNSNHDPASLLASWPNQTNEQQG